MKKFFINSQWQNKVFLIAIHRFSLVKAAMNALRVFVNCAKTDLPAFTSAQW
jgi:hypothetical protein